MLLVWVEWGGGWYGGGFCLLVELIHHSSIIFLVLGIFGGIVPGNRQTRFPCLRRAGFHGKCSNYAMLVVRGVLCL